MAFAAMIAAAAIHNSTSTGIIVVASATIGIALGMRRR